MSQMARKRANKSAAKDTPLVQRQDREKRDQEEAADEGYAVAGSKLPWREWLKRFFPKIASAEPAERHCKLWEWFERLVPGVKPKAKIDIWPRGGAKSSTAELGVAKVGEAGQRRFALYICETQPQADKHVQSIAKLFEKRGVGRAVNKYGTSKGWKRDQLRTANGFNVAGIGLDVATRGARLDNFRPDLIIIDDVDGLNDTVATTKKKIGILTQSLLPSGSSDCAVLFVQNKIIPHGVAGLLASGVADFLRDREKVVEEPAIYGLEVKREEAGDGLWVWRIIKGVASWAGQSIATCEKQIAEWGLSAFLREAQHKVDLAEGGLWDAIRDIDPFRIFATGPLDPRLPAFSKIVVAVDPSGSAGGDDAGIVVAGVRKIGKVLHGYVLESFAIHGSPEEWATAALDAYDAWEADELLGEVNFGGDMVESTFKAAGIDRGRAVPPVTMMRVSRGKLIRAQPVQLLYEKGQVHHVDDPELSDVGGESHKQLENQMCKWQPGMPSPGSLDAAVIALSRLFDLGEMVKEVKRPAAYSGARLLGSAGRGKVSRPASSAPSGSLFGGKRNR